MKKRSGSVSDSSSSSFSIDIGKEIEKPKDMEDIIKKKG